MTMPFRVTERSISSSTLRGLQENLTRMSDLQRRLSSGKQMARPSDSPIGTISAMQIRDEIRQLQQHVRNVDDGKGWLDTIDTALSSALDMTHRVRDLVLQGKSTGSADATARGALAAEIDTLRESLLAVANTTYLNRPVFGGTTPGQVAFDAAGSYVGDGGTVTRTVAPGTAVQVDASAAATFGTGPTQLFTLLAKISTDLRTNPDALDADLGQLDTSIAKVTAQLSDVGARYNRLERAGDSGDGRLIELKSQLSDVEDIDLPQTIVELQLQQTAYQAALSATAKVIQPSLIDFLR